MDYETIQLEIANGAARLTLNRPDRLNSFTVQMHDEVSRGLEAVDRQRRAAHVGRGEESVLRQHLYR